MRKGLVEKSRHAKLYAGHTVSPGEAASTPPPTDITLPSPGGWQVTPPSQTRVPSAGRARCLFQVPGCGREAGLSSTLSLSFSTCRNSALSPSHSAVGHEVPDTCSQGPRRRGPRGMKAEPPRGPVTGFTCRLLSPRARLAKDQPLSWSYNWRGWRHRAQQQTQWVMVLCGKQLSTANTAADPIQFCSVFEKIIEFK